MVAPKVKKFGIIGSSCAGKTTLAHTLVGRLKSYGVLADGLFSQDRKFSFDKQYLESEAAQNWMITNLIAKEVDITLHGDVQVFITDRTPLDLFAYYAYQHNTDLSRACWEYVKEWIKTYDALYYLPPLPFQDDGKRPTDEFRLNVDKVLVNLLDGNAFPNVHEMSRHEILNDVIQRAGINKPNVKRTFTAQDAQALANHLRAPLVVKDLDKDRDILSDYDVWILVEPNTVSRSYLEDVRTYARGLFGMFVDLDINLAYGLETFDFQYTVFAPQVKT